MIENIDDEIYANDIDFIGVQAEPIQLHGTISQHVAWFYRKADAIEYAKGMSNPMLLAKDKDETACKWSGVIEVARLMELVKSMGEIQNENLYCSSDNVLGHQPRFFMDIDADSNEITAEQWATLSAHYDEIPRLAHSWAMHHLAKFWNIDQISHEMPTVLKSIKPDGSYSKISFHIHYLFIFPALYSIRRRFQLFINGATDFDFPDWWPFGKSWTFVNAAGKTKNIMDPCPWSRGIFRLPFQSKLGKLARLMPMTDMAADYFNRCQTTNAMDTTPTESLDLTDDIAAALVVAPRPRQTAAAAAMEGAAAWSSAQPNDAERDEFLFYLSVIPKDSNTFIRNNIFAACKKHVAQLETDESKKRIWVECVRHFVTDHRIAKQGSQAAAYERLRKQYIRANTAATISYLQHHARIYCPNIQFDQPHEMRVIGDLYNSHNAEFNPIDIDEPYVRPITADADTIILRSSMGSGKSTQVRNYISGLDANISIIFLTNRRVLSRELICQYAEFGFIHYDDMKKKGYVDQETPRIIIQLESIHLIEQIQNINIVILDECESLINQLYSPTHCGSLLQHSQVFAEIVRKCDKLFCMDAFISAKTFALVKGLRPLRSVRYERYQQNPRPRSCEIFTASPGGSNSTMLNMLMSDVCNGKKLYIWSGSLRLLKQISRMIRNIGIDDSRILEITSEMSNKKKNEVFSDVNASWSAVDYVMASPSVTVGCNHNVPGHFDRAYVFINCMSTPVRDAVQAMMRCRELNDRNIVISVDECPPTEVDVHPLADFYKNGVFLAGGWHAELHRLMSIEQNVSRHFPMKTLLKLLSEGMFAVHINKQTDEQRVKLTISEEVEQKTNDLDYHWNKVSFFHFMEFHEIPRYQIDFNQINMDDVHNSIKEMTEDADEKDLFMRWMFQTRTRFATYWDDYDMLNDAWRKFNINGRYRADMLDNTSPLTLDKSIVLAHIRPVRGVELRRGAETAQRIRDAFGRIHQQALTIPMRGRNINVTPLHTKRIRCRVIRFLESLGSMTFSDVMTCDKTIDGQALAKYLEFVAFLQETAAQYGITLDKRYIRGEIISDVQAMHLFNQFAERTNLGFEIFKKEARTQINGVRTRIYTYALVNLNMSAGIYNDRRSIGYSAEPFDMEMLKYWRALFGRCCWQMLQSCNEIEHISSVEQFRLNKVQTVESHEINAIYIDNIEGVADATKFRYMNDDGDFVSNVLPNIIQVENINDVQPVAQAREAQAPAIPAVDEDRQPIVNIQDIREDRGTMLEYYESHRVVREAKPVNKTVRKSKKQFQPKINEF